MCKMGVAFEGQNYDGEIAGLQLSLLFIYLSVGFTLNGEIMVMSGNCQISITVEIDGSITLIIVMSFFEISFPSSSNHLLKHLLTSKCIIRSLKRNKHQRNINFHLNL